MKTKYKNGTLVEVCDYSEAHGQTGKVLWTQTDGLIMVELEGGACWPVIAKELKRCAAKAIAHKTKKPELVPVVTRHPCGPPVEPLTAHPAFPPPWMTRLWAHLRTEHGLLLTQDEMQQIVRIVREEDVKQKGAKSA